MQYIKKIVREEDFMFPGVKEYPRSKTKTLKYINDKEKKSQTKKLSDEEIQTAV